jgi:hypothetical protein
MQGIIRSLMGSTKVDETCARMVDLVRYYTKAPAVAVLHTDGGARFLRPVRSVGLSPAFRGTYRVRPGEGTEGAAFRLKRPAWVSDLHGLAGRAVEGEATRRVLESEGVQAVVAAPLRLQGKPVGVVAGYYRAAATFGSDTVVLLGAIADAASLALDRGEEIEAALEAAALMGVRQLVVTLSHEIHSPSPPSSRPPSSSCVVARRPPATPTGGTGRSMAVRWRPSYPPDRRSPTSCASSDGSTGTGPPTTWAGSA